MSDLSQHIINQVTRAYEDSTPLNIVGGNTKSFMGRTPDGEELSVAQHRGIISYDPIELVIRVRSGTPIKEIKAALNEQGQMLPCETPEYGGNATIAGSLATNQSGPARPWFGALRDCVLGLNLVNGRGELLRLGGQVMKNVAGYDLSRLQSGAMGCFGVITELSLRVLPIPETNVTIQRESSAEDAIKHFNQLAGKNIPLSAAYWHNNIQTIRLSGEASTVENCATLIGGEKIKGNKQWCDLRELHHPFFKQHQQKLWRFSISSAAPHFKKEQDWLIDWAGSQRWLLGEFEHGMLENHATQSGGEVSLFRGGDRQQEVLHSADMIKQNLYCRLKSAFDPNGIFNPGRLYGWL